MTSHLSNEQLQDRADGAVEPGFDAHVAECEVCRAELAALSSLKTKLALLPREDEVLPVALASIRDRVRAEERRRSSKRSRFIERGIISSAIAATVLGLVFAKIREDARGPVEPGTPWSMKIRIGSVAIEINSAEREYDGALKDLLAELEARRRVIDPQTMAMIDQNLVLIDEAIRSSRKALDEDPSNIAASTHLTSVYQSKLDLLRKVTRLPSSI